MSKDGYGDRCMGGGVIGGRLTTGRPTVSRISMNLENASVGRSILCSTSSSFSSGRSFRTNSPVRDSRARESSSVSERPIRSFFTLMNGRRSSCHCLSSCVISQSDGIPSTSRSSVSSPTEDKTFSSALQTCAAECIVQSSDLQSTLRLSFPISCAS